MELLLGLFSIILFYLITPGILITMKGNKYIIAIGHAILFSILFSILFYIVGTFGSKTIEKLSNPNTTACPGNAVHSNWGQGKDCMQCPSINGVQMASFPHLVTTELGTWGFDGFCGFANNYDSNGNINTVIYPNKCPINEITNKKKTEDTPVYIPSFDPNLRFCLANAEDVKKFSGFENFNMIMNTGYPIVPPYLASGDPKSGNKLMQ